MDNFKRDEQFFPIFAVLPHMGLFFWIEVDGFRFKLKLIPRKNKLCVYLRSFF